MLNATILVQVIHFLCAYVCLRALFLKKAVYLIQQEQKEHAFIRESIDIHETELADLQEKNKNRWHSFVELYQHEKPHVEYNVISVSVIKPAQKPEEDLDKKTVDTLTHLIIEQADYGN